MNAATRPSSGHALRPLLEKAWPAMLLVAALILVSHGWGLGRAPLSKTEGVRALTGSQMLETGDWVVPHLYGSVYLRKPPLFYWAVATSEKVFGRGTEWVWRLPSILSAAGTAALLVLLGRRWFGPWAGLISGLSFVGLVAVWSQNRGSEIDALNNFCSVLAAGSLLELGFGRSRRRWAWSLLLALGLAGALMAKGPAGFPVIAGVLLGAGILTRNARWLLRPSIWLGMAAGGALFAAWYLAVQSALAADPASADLSGVKEVASRLSPFVQLKKHGLEILTLPIVLMAYAFPFSASFFLLTPLSVRERLPDAERAMASALCGSFALSLLVGMVAMISNPRYMYMTLPLLCLLTGAAWYAGSQAALSIRALRATRWILIVFAALGAVCQIVFTVIGWPAPWLDRVVLILAGAASIILAVRAVLMFRRRHLLRAAGLLAMQMVLVSLAFTALKNHEREQETGALTGRALAERLPAGTLLHAERMIFAHPEVIHYGGMRVQRYPGEIREEFTPVASGWYLLHPREWEEWGQHQGDRMQQVERLPGPDEPYLAHFDL